MTPTEIAERSLTPWAPEGRRQGPRFVGPQVKGIMRSYRQVKREEAEERNARTPVERLAATRRKEAST
jgi:hypothetical protein